jgi:uncharacterized membrane protein
MNTELDFSNAEALDVSNADATTQATVKTKPKLDFKKLQNIADTVKKASIKVAPILEGVKNNFAKNAGKKEEPKKEEPKNEEATEATNETAKTTETKDNKKFLGMPKAIGITVVVVGGLALIVGGYFAYKKFSKK